MALLEKVVLNKQLPMSYVKENEKKWDFWDESYEGESEYIDEKDDRGNPILIPFDCERRPDYQKRKDITPIKNYTKPIVEKYNSSVFRNAPIRTDFPEYLFNDCDGLGTNYDELMAKALKVAQIYGVSYLMPLQSNIGETLTIAQSQAVGARHFVRLLEPENVAEVEEVDDVLVEAIVMLTDENGVAFARYMNNQVYVDIALDKNGRVSSIGAEVIHGYSKIPLVKVTPEVTSESQVAPIANSQKHITNLNSLLIHELVEQNFTRWLMAGIRVNEDPEMLDKMQAMWSSKRLMVVEDAGVTATRLGSDISQAESIRTSIKDELTEMYRNAGLSASNVDMSSTIQSGISLIVNREDFFLICSKLKSAIEVADNKLMQLISEQEGFAYVPTVYSDNYMAQDESEAILKLRDILALNIPTVLKNAMIQKYAETFFSLSEQQIAQLAQELNGQSA